MLRVGKHREVVSHTGGGNVNWYKRPGKQFDEKFKRLEKANLFKMSLLFCDIHRFLISPPHPLGSFHHCAYHMGLE